MARRAGDDGISDMDDEHLQSLIAPAGVRLTSARVRARPPGRGGRAASRSLSWRLARFGVVLSVLCAGLVLLATGWSVLCSLAAVRRFAPELSELRARVPLDYCARGELCGRVPLVEGLAELPHPRPGNGRADGWRRWDSEHGKPASRREPCPDGSGSDARTGTCRAGSGLGPGGHGPVPGAGGDRTSTGSFSGHVFHTAPHAPSFASASPSPSRSRRRSAISYFPFSLLRWIPLSSYVLGPPLPPPSTADARDAELLAMLPRALPPGERYDLAIRLVVRPVPQDRAAAARGGGGGRRNDAQDGGEESGKGSGKDGGGVVFTEEWTDPGARRDMGVGGGATAWERQDMGTGGQWGGAAGWGYGPQGAGARWQGGGGAGDGWGGQEASWGGPRREGGANDPNARGGGDPNAAGGWDAGPNEQMGAAGQGKQGAGQAGGNPRAGQGQGSPGGGGYQSGPSQNGYAHAGPFQNGPFQNGPFQNGQHQNGQFQNGPFQNGQHQNGQFQNGQNGYYRGPQGGGYPGGPGPYPFAGYPAAYPHPSMIRLSTVPSSSSSSSASASSSSSPSSHAGPASAARVRARLVGIDGASLASASRAARLLRDRSGLARLVRRLAAFVGLVSDVDVVDVAMLGPYRERLEAPAVAVDVAIAAPHGGGPGVDVVQAEIRLTVRMGLVRRALWLAKPGMLASVAALLLGLGTLAAGLATIVFAFILNLFLR